MTWADRLTAALLSPSLTGLPALAGIAASTLVSEDLACVAAGLLASRGAITFLEACLACYVGILGGDLLLFFLGRWGGRAALARAPLRWWISPSAVARGEAWFAKNGGPTLFASRFLPGTRLATYVAAGVLGCSPRTFVIWLGGACAIWTPLLVWLSMRLGGAALERVESTGKKGLLALVGALALYFVATRAIAPLLTWRGRRLALGRWHRLTRWEFWPAWLVEGPVVAWVVALAFRHRGLAFAAVNPAMPMSGFVHESKAEILAGLAAAGAPVARFEVVPAELSAEARIDLVERFFDREGLTYPIVVKPDIGQRGEGVSIARDRAGLAERLANARGNVIVQEYIPGREFGVFYIRRPEEERGWIFSITDKRLIGVVGDGTRTVEELILADPRAVSMAPTFLDRHAARLGEIPAHGEHFELTEVGNHCRGALFLDGSHLATPELVHAIDAASRGYSGFFFGRYDLRVPSEDDLRAGRSFAILELNGVTSEATHIYDPKAGLIAAWRTLFTQWRLAFEIGAENLRRGAPPTALRDLLGSIREHFWPKNR